MATTWRRRTKNKKAQSIPKERKALCRTAQALCMSTLTRRRWKLGRNQTVGVWIDFTFMMMSIFNWSAHVAWQLLWRNCCIGYWYVVSSLMSRRQSPKILKKQDGEPISRNDLQFDLLATIFSDGNEVFPDPSQIQDDKPKKVTFGYVANFLNFMPPWADVLNRNLYINNILNSPKASKILKDKMLDSAGRFTMNS